MNPEPIPAGHSRRKAESAAAGGGQRPAEPARAGGGLSLPRRPRTRRPRPRPIHPSRLRGGMGKVDAIRRLAMHSGAPGPPRRCGAIHNRLAALGAGLHPRPPPAGIGARRGRADGLGGKPRRAAGRIRLRRRRPIRRRLRGRARRPPRMRPAREKPRGKNRTGNAALSQSGAARLAVRSTQGAFRD